MSTLWDSLQAQLVFINQEPPWRVKTSKCLFVCVRVRGSPHLQRNCPRHHLDTLVVSSLAQLLIFSTEQLHLLLTEAKTNAHRLFGQSEK